MAIFLLRCYKLLLSPLMPPACRFLPSCSEYTSDAIKKHGVVKGAILGLKRILRCHPFGGSGCDFVP